MPDTLPQATLPVKLEGVQADPACVETGQNRVTFEELLELRDRLRETHALCCDDVNGRLGAGESSGEARLRDRTYRKLCEVEETIAAILSAERAQEESAEPCVGDARFDAEREATTPRGGFW